MRPFRRLLALIVTLPLLAAAHAGDYPERAVTLVVPFAAGGPTDTTARVIAKSFAEYSGQPFVVENRGGAGSLIGTSNVADSAPDGYRLLFATSTAMVISPHLHADIRYDPFKSFKPIGKVVTTPFVVLVGADSPYKTYEDLVAVGKADPGSLNYGTPGAGTVQHLTISRITGESGFEAENIPFRGGAPAMMGLIGGEVDFLIDTTSVALAQINAGTVRALAVTSPERVPELPDVPTLQELGLDGFLSFSWFALLAPAETPDTAVDKLKEMLDRALQDPAMRASFRDIGFTPANVDDEPLAEQMQREYQLWGDIIKKSDISIR